MLPSMPKGEIVRMNVDGIPLKEYPKHCRVLTCYIHDYVCHWCQHSNKSMKTGRVADRDLIGRDNGLIVWWWAAKDMFYTMSWCWGSMRET